VNYSRIVLFSVGLYLLLVATSTIATLIVGADEAIMISIPFFVTLHVIGFIFSLFMYMYLAYKQATKPYLQAMLVASIYWIISLISSSLLYLFLAIPFEAILYLFPVLLHLIAILLGTLSGIQLRSRRKKSAQLL
jgi:hypothetical protein